MKDTSELLEVLKRPSVTIPSTKPRQQIFTTFPED